MAEFEPAICIVVVVAWFTCVCDLFYLRVMFVIAQVIYVAVKIVIRFVMV